MPAWLSTRYGSMVKRVSTTPKAKKKAKPKAKKSNVAKPGDPVPVVNLGGRPSKYTQDLVDACVDYLANHKAYEDAVPSVAGLAVHLGISRETLYAWEHDETKAGFSDILRSIVSKQERMLLSGGLTSDFNAAIVKLMLGKHGYSEKHQNELTGADGGPVEVIERRIVKPGDKT